ncbi:endopeptidase La [Miniphocaeibacter halophilus]|uniref:Endopeptidase La n=1 Tax=Miniphocaeibacter halophilus TaxID=2931922 RepID=A0AC61MU45_9FIRM|nr:endopeptidase La [Miniphocaeibacter halophilus]QQK07834.1 endopeptidase La [Miniphocaeibacter halophilus]
MNKNITYEVKNIRLPIIPMRGIWIFPNTIIHFDVGRDISINALNESMIKDSLIFLTAQKDASIDEPKIGDFYDTGVIAEIKQTLKLPNGNMRILVEGISRAEAKEFIFEDNYIQAELKEYVYNEEKVVLDDNLKAITRLVVNDAKEYISLNPNISTEMILPILEQDDPSRLADIVASYINLEGDDYFNIIKELDIYKRLEILHGILLKEIEYLKIEEEINKKVSKQISKNQREYYLKEQLMAIRQELGEDDDEEIAFKYTEQLKKLKLNKKSEEHVLKEINRLNILSPGSPDVNVIRSYVEEILSLPWNKTTKEKYDIKKARDILEEDHYGLEDVKERVLEFIAVKKMTKGLKGPILCLVGPPGVGKTSIVKSIARATNRNFVSMRLGGVRDEAEIRGHRKTYIGAMPGRIIKLMEDAGTTNPVFLLDEIDKLSSDFRGDPASALLEVLDPAQNDAFIDNYIEIPFDLSKVMFVTTANSLNTIPAALLDRMEIIRISGYTEFEKLNIAEKYLIPKQVKEHGLKPNQFSISTDSVKKMITNYTREAGVRNLERLISKAVRKAVMDIVEKNKKAVRISLRNLEKYIGNVKIVDDDIPKEDMVGVVNGLAWTETGGEILTIEATVMEGSGKVQLTGMLGDVMKESAMAAVSFIRSNQEKLGIKGEFYKNKDIHLHFPEGAVPKDGPSAGVSIITALVSALSGKKVSHDIAMTGEITLRGRVLPIGGVKEKVLAANRYGIKNIILPKANEKDVELIPNKVRKLLQFSYVETIDEVLNLAIKES